MAQTTYHYSIQNDFPNHKVAPDRLAQEINQSSIVIALVSIDTVGDDCAITFKDALSIADKTTLDTIVATHTGVPLPAGGIPVSLADAAGNLLATSNNVPVTLPNLFPIGVILDLIGAGDDPVLGRGKGPAFMLQGPANGADISVNFQFNDWVIFAGGGLSTIGAVFGDNVDMSVAAPATPVTPAPGGNTGNCNLVDPGVGSPVMIVPAPGNGAFNVNLANAVPVPSPTYTGYFDWDEPDTGKGNVVVGVPGQAAYNLFTILMPLSRYVTRMPLLDSRSINLTVPAVKPTKILPQWFGTVTLHSPTQSQVQLTWYLVTARMRTT